MGTAKLLITKPRNEVGADWKVFEVDPPMATEDGTTKYVVVSANTVYYTGPETYIFASDEHGEITDWGELDGSYRGGLDHAEALRGAGYEVTS